MGSPANITNRSKVAGLGEQPSITDRDLGDETERLSDEVHSAHMADLFTQFARVPVLPYPGLATYPPLGSDAQRIMALEAEVQHLHQAHEQYVDAQRVLMKNACDWRDAEIERLRAALASAQPTTKEPPHPLTNALTHGWATTRYPTERT